MRSHSSLFCLVTQPVYVDSSSADIAAKLLFAGTWAIIYLHTTWGLGALGLGVRGWGSISGHHLIGSPPHGALSLSLNPALRSARQTRCGSCSACIDTAVAIPVYIDTTTVRAGMSAVDAVVLGPAAALLRLRRSPRMYVCMHACMV